MKAVVLGSGGLLGSVLLRQLSIGEHGADAVQGFSHADLDVTNSTVLRAMFEKYQPAIVWNCVAFNGVDAAESSPDAAMALNVAAPKELAILCKEFNATLVHFSTGYVFDGTSDTGYAEDAAPNPQSAYARSKYAGEQAITENLASYYIVRLNWLFGRQGRSSHSKRTFPDMVVELASQPAPLRMVNDEFATPTYAEDLATAVISMAVQKLPFGMYHFSNTGKASWYEFAQETLRLNHIDRLIEPITGTSLARPAVRPKNAVLLNTKLPAQRDWREALAAYYNERT